jgi:hypothetical protein
LRAKIQKLGETIEKRVKRKISIKERALITTPTAVCVTQTMTMRQAQVPKDPITPRYAMSGFLDFGKKKSRRKGMAYGGFHKTLFWAIWHSNAFSHLKRLL